MAGLFKTLGQFFGGQPEKRENLSLLRPEQEDLYRQLVRASMQRGAGGAYGTAADYYRGLLSDDSADMDAFAAPEMRRYYQDIVPSLAEQFAGMGSGALSSSGFRNAQIQGATDLSERLGAIRARLRESGAQGLQGIGNQGLQNYSQNMITQQGGPGLLSTLSPLVGTAIGSYFGPGGAAAGGALGSWLSNSFGERKVAANTQPYQSRNIPASPNMNFNLPNFMQGR